MAIEVTLPRQGWSMEEAAFVEWLKKDGDEVKAGEPLFSVETDKAVQEIESLDAGILRLTASSPKKDDKVRVGDVLGYLVAPGEATPAGAPAPSDRAGSLPEEGTARRPPEDRRSPGERDPIRGDKAVPAGCPVSPRAARRAVHEGVDLRTVGGTGKGGRVRERDIVAAIQGAGAASVVAARPAAPVVPPVPGREEPATALRRKVAERMSRSKAETAQVTLTTRADVTALVKLRARFKAAGRSVVPGYNDMLMKLAGGMLRAHPALNARWMGDRILYPDAINIGLAVDTEDGLLVPVVRDVPALSLAQVAECSASLVAKARARKLGAGDLSGGTFTITNLGSMGVDAFTPIINFPECAVLGVGRISREPVVVDDKVVVRDRLWLSLTFDHRIVDGGPAARFLDELSRAVADPPACIAEH